MNIKNIDKYIFDGDLIKDFVSEISDRITTYEDSQNFQITNLQKSFNSLEDIGDNIDSLYINILRSVFQSGIDIPAFGLNVIAGQDLEPFNHLIGETITGYCLPGNAEDVDIDLINIEPEPFRVLVDGVITDVTAEDNESYVHYGHPYAYSLESGDIEDLNKIPVVYEAIIQTDLEAEGYHCYGSVYEGMEPAKFNLIITGNDIKCVSLLIDCDDINIDNIEPEGITRSFVNGKLFLNSALGVSQIVIPITGKFERVENVK